MYLNISIYLKQVIKCNNIFLNLEFLYFLIQNPVYLKDQNSAPSKHDIVYPFLSPDRTDLNSTSAKNCCHNDILFLIYLEKCQRNFFSFCYWEFCAKNTAKYQQTILNLQGYRHESFQKIVFNFSFIQIWVNSAVRVVYMKFSRL